jgi:hypothetical protein
MSVLVTSTAAYHLKFNQEFGNDRVIPFKFGVRYGDRVPAEGGG